MSKINEFKDLIENLWMTQDEGETARFEVDENSWFQLEFDYDYDDNGRLALLISEYEKNVSDGNTTPGYLGGILLTDDNIETPKSLEKICEDILIKKIHRV